MVSEVFLTCLPALASFITSFFAFSLSLSSFPLSLPILREALVIIRFESFICSGWMRKGVLPGVRDFDFDSLFPIDYFLFNY